jgi:protein-tyrosine phosphatase
MAKQDGLVRPSLFNASFPDNHFSLLGKVANKTPKIRLMIASTKSIFEDCMGLDLPRPCYGFPAAGQRAHSSMLRIPCRRSTSFNMDHSQILSHLHVGSCPRSRGDINRLKNEAGITAVVNLQTEGDFSYWDIDWPVLEAHYREADVDIRRVPVLDFNPDALRANLPRCVEVVAGLIRDGHTVYVHCNVGVNRSPSVAIAYLYWIEGRALEDAVEQVLRCRSCNPYAEAIRLATEDRAQDGGSA